MTGLENMRNDDGTFVEYAWPGGYPVFYVTRDGCVLHPTCADETPEDVTACDVNWEDPDLWCDECAKRIESAYAEDEVA